jgi:hypothetical protein
MRYFFILLLILFVGCGEEKKEENRTPPEKIIIETECTKDSDCFVGKCWEVKQDYGEYKKTYDIEYKQECLIHECDSIVMSRDGEGNNYIYKLENGICVMEDYDLKR